jgi:DNA polymerase-3 subunit epsilon
VRRVTWDETAGELGALLLEARLIRDGQPLCNRALKPGPCICTIVVADDGAPPRIMPVDAVQLSFEPSDCFSLFRSERAARAALASLAREHRLCLKTLGLEQAEGSCFAFQLGRCEGACVGREPLARHTIRLKLALAATHLKPWPFAGPVAIRERSPNGLEQVHVVDEWQHLATIDATDGDELGELARAGSRRRVPFDLEAYRIISRYLKQASPRDVRPLTRPPADFEFDAA